MLTRQEFIDEYCNKSKVSWKFLSKYREAIPCECGDEYCNGWAMVEIDTLKERTA